MEMQEEEHGEEDLEEQEKVMVAFWNSCVLLQLEMAAALFALLETPAQEAVRDALRETEASSLVLHFLDSSDPRAEENSNMPEDTRLLVQLQLLDLACGLPMVSPSDDLHAHLVRLANKAGFRTESFANLLGCSTTIASPAGQVQSPLLLEDVGSVEGLRSLDYSPTPETLLSAELAHLLQGPLAAACPILARVTSRRLQESLLASAHPSALKMIRHLSMATLAENYDVSLSCPNSWSLSVGKLVPSSSHSRVHLFSEFFDKILAALDESNDAMLHHYLSLFPRLSFLALLIFWDRFNFEKLRKLTDSIVGSCQPEKPLGVGDTGASDTLFSRVLAAGEHLKAQVKLLSFVKEYAPLKSGEEWTEAVRKRLAHQSMVAALAKDLRLMPDLEFLRLLQQEDLQNPFDLRLLLNFFCMCRLVDIATGEDHGAHDGLESTGEGRQSPHGEDGEGDGERGDPTNGVMDSGVRRPSGQSSLQDGREDSRSVERDGEAAAAAATENKLLEGLEVETFLQLTSMMDVESAVFLLENSLAVVLQVMLHGGRQLQRLPVLTQIMMDLGNRISDRLSRGEAAEHRDALKKRMEAVTKQLKEAEWRVDFMRRLTKGSGLDVNLSLCKPSALIVTSLAWGDVHAAKEVLLQYNLQEEDVPETLRIECFGEILRKSTERWGEAQAEGHDLLMQKLANEAFEEYPAALREQHRIEDLVQAAICGPGGTSVALLKELYDVICSGTECEEWEKLLRLVTHSIHDLVKEPCVVHGWTDMVVSPSEVLWSLGPLQPIVPIPSSKDVPKLPHRCLGFLQASLPNQVIANYASPTMESEPSVGLSPLGAIMSLNSDVRAICPLSAAMSDHLQGLHAILAPQGIEIKDVDSLSLLSTILKLYEEGELDVLECLAQTSGIEIKRLMANLHRLTREGETLRWSDYEMIWSPAANHGVVLPHVEQWVHRTLRVPTYNVASFTLFSDANPSVTNLLFLACCSSDTAPSRELLQQVLSSSALHSKSPLGRYMLQRVCTVLMACITGIEEDSRDEWERAQAYSDGFSGKQEVLRSDLGPAMRMVDVSIESLDEATRKMMDLVSRTSRLFYLSSIKRFELDSHGFQIQEEINSGNISPDLSPLFNKTGLFLQYTAEDLENALATCDAADSWKYICRMEDIKHRNRLTMRSFQCWEFPVGFCMLQMMLHTVPTHSTIIPGCHRSVPEVQRILDRMMLAEKLCGLLQSMPASMKRSLSASKTSSLSNLPGATSPHSSSAGPASSRTSSFSSPPTSPSQKASTAGSAVPSGDSSTADTTSLDWDHWSGVLQQLEEDPTPVIRALSMQGYAEEAASLLSLDFVKELMGTDFKWDVFLSQEQEDVHTFLSKALTLGDAMAYPLCRAALSRYEIPEDKLAILDMIMERFSLQEAEKEELMKVKQNCQLRECLQEYVADFEEILDQPRLIAESLIMWGETEIVRDLYSRIPELEDTPMLLRYARKALVNLSRISYDAASEEDSDEEGPENSRIVLSGLSSLDDVSREEHRYRTAPDMLLAKQIMDLSTKHTKVARFCIDVADELSARFSDITIEERLGFSSLLSHLVYFAKTLFSKSADAADQISMCTNLISQINLLQSLKVQLPDLNLRLTNLSDTTIIRQLRDHLVRRDHMQLAMELCGSCGVEADSVWSEWGIALLECGNFQKAREKFNNFKSISLQSKKAVLSRILQILEAPHTCSEGYGRQPFSSCGSYVFERLNSRPGQEIHQSPWFQECLHYLERFGNDGARLDFFVRHKLLERAMELVLSNDVKEELFLEHVLDECLATGYASELLDAIRAVDPSLKRTWRYLFASCRKLSSEKRLHILLDFQLAMEDYSRAGLTSVHLFKNALDLQEKLDLLYKAQEYFSAALNSTSSICKPHLPISDLRNYVQIISLQINVSKALGSDAPSATLFEDNDARMVVTEALLKKNFGLAFQVMNEFRLQLTTVINRTMIQLAQGRQYVQLQELLKETKGTIPDSDLDSIILNVVQVMCLQLEDYKQAEKLVSKLVDVGQQVKACILCKKYRVGYLLAADQNRSDLVRLLRAELLASQGKEVENLLGLCDQFLARHDSLRDSSFEEKRGR